MQSVSKRVSTYTTTLLAMALGVLVATPAYAGFDRINTVFTTVNGWLIGAGTVILTSCILWAGYKMMFAGANFQEVSKPLIGGIVVGGAPVIAGLLIA